MCALWRESRWSPTPGSEVAGVIVKIYVRGRVSLWGRTIFLGITGDQDADFLIGVDGAMASTC